MKKILLLSLIALGSLNQSFGQCTNMPVLNVNNSNSVLYSDYDNIIEVAVNCPGTVNVTGIGVTLKSMGNNKYSARINGESKTVKINVSNTSKTKMTSNLGSYSFKVLPYPAPQLYFDNNDPKSMVSRIGEHVLDVKSPADLYKSMMISNWEVIMENGTSISGTGNNLSPAANAAITAAPARSSVVIAVTYTNSNGGVSETKNTRATFYIE